MTCCNGDRHGILMIPKAVEAEVPAVAAKLQGAEQRAIDCRSQNFSVGQLRRIVQDLT